MKNIVLFLFILIAGTESIHAQARPAPKPLDVLPITNIAETASGLLGILKTKLAMSDTQGPKMTSLLTEFLNSKSGIIPLARTNPADYTVKFAGIKEKFLNGLKSELTSAQYTKFLGLKPKASETDNLLHHLFF